MGTDLEVRQRGESDKESEAALSRRLDVCGRSVSRSKESDVDVELDEDVM